MSRSSSLAKTTRPTLSGVLIRERLFALLDRCRRSPLVWVSGPPGSGKTTLVASYLESRQPECRWYQLDAGDADVATLFYHMGNAATRGAQAVAESLPLYTSEYHDDLSAFTRRYFQTLFASLRTPFVVAFDNFHEVPLQSAFHAVLLDAAMEVPPEGCLVVISRAEPPPTLVRLRANRELEYVGWNALRLTREESDAIITRWDPTFSQFAREQLYEKTQGWAAGLVLMLDQAKAEGAVADLPDMSAPHLIFDYLAGEIFQTFDERTRELLLKTAYVPEISGDMAAALSGDAEAGACLARLHRSYHLVSLRTGAGGPVYQYHPLLKDFLRARASSSLPPAECRALRRRTAGLLEAEGAVEDAMALLRDDRDWSELSRLVLDHAGEMLRHGRVETLEHWLEELPEAMLRDEPWYYYWRAACRFYSAPRDSRRLYEQAFDRFSGGDTLDLQGMLLTCAGAMDAIIYGLDDLSLLDRWIETASVLLDEQEELPWPDVQARICVSMFLSLVFRQPQHPDMQQWAEQAHQRLHAVEDTNTRITAQLLVAITLNYTGQFTRARDFIDGMRQTCRSSHVTPLALKVLKDVESMFYMLTGDHERCLRAVHDGLEVGQANGVRSWSYHLLSNGAAGALSAGDLETAEQLLEQMRDHRESARRLDLCTYHHYSAWLAILRNDNLLAFQEQKTALRLAIEAGCPFYEILCRLAQAQVLMALGDETRARTQLRRLHALARGIDNRLLEFQSLLGFAHMAFTVGRERSGRNALRYALGVGREFGFFHFIWWRPDVVAELCVRALEEGIETEYVQRLIRKRDLMPARPPLAVSNWPWHFRIQSFADFRLERDARPLGLSAKLQRKPMALLKAIVALGGERVPEATLAETLWPRIDGDYAQKSLTTTLHRLRKLLGEDRALVLRNGRLSLDRRYCWLDVWALESEAENVQSLMKSSPGAGAADRVEALAESVFGLYHGPFMQSEDDEPRYRAPRERLRNRFLRAVGSLARYWEDRGEWERALDYYQRALEADTLAEGLYRRLMLCYRELGRQAEGIDIYDRCRRVFRAELDVEPSLETTAIYRTLLNEL